MQPTKEHGIKMNTYSANNANVNDEEDQEKEQLRDEIDVSNCTNSFLRTVCLPSVAWSSEQFSYQLDTEQP